MMKAGYLQVSTSRALRRPSFHCCIMGMCGNLKRSKDTHHNALKYDLYRRYAKIAPVEDVYLKEWGLSAER